MVIVTWLMAVGFLSLWWLWRIDLPDRNPFAVIRWYRLLLLLMFLSLLGVGYKAQAYRTELRFVIQACR